MRKADYSRRRLVDGGIFAVELKRSNQRRQKKPFVIGPKHLLKRGKAGANSLSRKHAESLKGKARLHRRIQAHAPADRSLPPLPAALMRTSRNDANRQIRLSKCVEWRPSVVRKPSDGRLQI